MRHALLGTLLLAALLITLEGRRPVTEPTLRLFRRQAATEVLGPHRRAVLWVQGCPFRCAGCIVPESWDPEAEPEVPVAEVADWVLRCPDVEGLTLSGGEPMSQAGPLAELVRRVRTVRDLGVVCYTGHRLEWLVERGTPEQRDLLAQVDLLIDGPYVKGRHADLLWRGSDNQRLLPLTGRYGAVVAAAEDRGAGMELDVDPAGRVSFTGVPSQPEFRDRLEEALLLRGVHLPAPTREETNR